MSIINKLNDRLNYNQEVYYLSIVLVIIFGSAAFITIRKAMIQLSLFFSFMFTFCIGIAAASFIYNRDDNFYYGYIVRDKILGWFRR